MIQVVFAMHYEIRKYKQYYIFCKVNQTERRRRIKKTHINFYDSSEHIIYWNFGLLLHPIMCGRHTGVSICDCVWSTHNDIFAIAWLWYHGIQLTHCHKLSHHMGHLIFKQISIPRLLSFPLLSRAKTSFLNWCDDTDSFDERNSNWHKIHTIYEYNSHMLHIHTPLFVTVYTMCVVCLNFGLDHLHCSQFIGFTLIIQHRNSIFKSQNFRFLLSLLRHFCLLSNYPIA